MKMATGKLLEVEIADVSRLIFSGFCTQLVAPAAFGEVGILFGHTPFLTRLLPGQVRLQTDVGEEQLFFVSGGYMEVQPRSVTVLADQMLRSEEIDRSAALQAKRKAEAILKKNPLFRERDEAHLMLVKAIAQLRVLEHAERLGLRNPQR